MPFSSPLITCFFDLAELCLRRITSGNTAGWKVQWTSPHLVHVKKKKGSYFPYRNMSLYMNQAFFYWIAKALSTPHDLAWASSVGWGKGHRTPTPSFHGVLSGTEIIITIIIQHKPHWEYDAIDLFHQKSLDQVLPRTKDQPVPPENRPGVKWDVLCLHDQNSDLFYTTHCVIQTFQWTE